MRQTTGRQIARFHAPLAIVATGAMITPAALGQAGPLIMKPWDNAKPHIAETFDDISYIPGGSVDQTGDDIDVFYWASTGRIKFDKTDSDPKFWIGYDMVQIELGGNPRGLAGGYSDISVQGAYKLGEIGDGWDITLAAGAGIATDNHFGDGNAVYGIATINAVKKLSDTASITIGVSYDGNRTILPDVPLPYAVYLDQLDKHFTYYLGLPVSGFTWTPDDLWRISANLTLPDGINASVSYQILPDKLSVVAEYKKTLDAFWQHDSDHTRIFYEMSRVSLGLRWIWEPWVDLTGGVGYAFSQDFKSGWDTRDTDTFASPSNEPLLFFTIRGTF